MDSPLCCHQPAATFFWRLQSCCTAMYNSTSGKNLYLWRTYTPIHLASCCTGSLPLGGAVRDGAIFWLSGKKSLNNKIQVKKPYLSQSVRLSDAVQFTAALLHKTMPKCQVWTGSLSNCVPIYWLLPVTVFKWAIGVPHSNSLASYWLIITYWFRLVTNHQVLVGCWLELRGDLMAAEMPPVPPAEEEEVL